MNLGANIALGDLAHILCERAFANPVNVPNSDT